MENQKRIKCLDATINYIDEGNGDVILFIHNGGGFLQLWTKQIEYFSHSYRVIALDLPGFGESSESLNAYTLDYYIRIIHDFLNKLKINELNIVGNCIGASLAIRSKIMYPEKVKKIVLINICPGKRLIRSPLLRILIFKIKSKSFRARFSSLITFLYLKTFTKNRFPGILFGKNPDKESIIYKKYIEKMQSSKQMRSRLNLLFASDTFTLKLYMGDNSKIKNALLIWGECNRVASLKREGKYHRALCGIKNINVVKDSGHLLMYESPDETNKLIKNYLES